MSITLNQKEISTVGELRAALSSVPDDALLNIGTEDLGFDVSRVAYDGISVAIESADLSLYMKQEGEK